MVAAQKAAALRNVFEPLDADTEQPTDESREKGQEVFVECALSLMLVHNRGAQPNARQSVS